MRRVSRSSAEAGPDPGPDRARRRAQVEPVAALVAVLAVGAGLGLYVGALDDATPATDDLAAEAESTLDRVEQDATGADAVVVPRDLAIPDDRRGSGTLRVELRADDNRWVADTDLDADESQRRPPSATAERDVPVRVAPGRTVGGTLRVAVWR